MAPIEVGEEHLYYRGKWDGEFTADRQHMLCREVCMELNRPSREWSGECEIGFGALWEHWRGCWQADRQCKPEQFAKAKEIRSKVARIKWRERRFKTRRKRVQGVLYKRPWGGQWVVVPEKLFKAEDGLLSISGG
jgi:hypothetical protein